MNLKEAELRQERAKVLDAMGALNKKAKDERRDLIGTEQEQWDSWEAEYRRLDGEIARGALQAKREADQLLPVDSRKSKGVGLEDGADDDHYETGAILKPSQSVRSYLQNSGLITKPEFEGLGLGALMRSKVTGPRNDLERRAQAELTDAAGGFTVPDFLMGNFIDKLRAQIVCIRLGAQTVPLTTDKSTIARIATDPVATWRAENAPVTEDEAVFEGVVLTARSLAVLVKASREVLEDSVNINAALEASLRGAMAVEVDRVCLLGSGTPPEPRGIYNTVGINSLPAGPFTDYDDLIDAMAANWDDNSPVTSGIVVSPQNLAALSKLKESTTDAPLRKPDILQDVPIVMTTSMDDGSAIIGDFSKLIIGIRTSLRIEILRELFAENMQYAFLAHLRMDLAVEHPESFCRLVIST